MKGNILVVMDRYGVKHIAPYSLYYRMPSGKKKDIATMKRANKQEAKTIEHGIKRK